MTNTRRFFVAFALIVVLCVCALVWLRPREVSSFYAFASRDSTTKTILYWNPFYDRADFYLGEGPIALNCPKFNNCLATHSRFVQSVDSFDAIVFHGINDQLDDRDLPSSRKPQQRYVFFGMESPAYRYVDNEFDGYFNLTMTYQLDSDIVYSYSDVVNKADVNRSEGSYNDWMHGASMDDDSMEESILDKLIRGKKRMAVWYRSNCQAVSGREHYAKELENHINVANYGSCSVERGCPRDQDCFKTDVEPNYFFYLSFENSLCEDYVTEKFYNALQYQVVPVVYGGADYHHLAPPHSYINALDFDTPKDLADYLIKLAANVTEYKKYFDWKKQYRVVIPRRRIICDLCAILNGNQKKTYEISKWYSTEKCPLQRQLHKQKLNGGLGYATKKTFLVR